MYLRDRCCGDCRCSTRGKKPSGSCIFSALRTLVQNSCGLLSFSSREIQATRGCLGGNDRTQVDNRVVLPKPAGAHMSVTGLFRLSCSRPVRRGREITVPDATGTKNLVAAS